MDNDGTELGVIKHVSELAPESSALLIDELQKKYAMPKVIRILSTKQRFGITDWEVETIDGEDNFATRNSDEFYLTITDDRIIILDLDERCFEIPSISQLDVKSQTLLKRHL